MGNVPSSSYPLQNEDEHSMKRGTNFNISSSYTNDAQKKSGPQKEFSVTSFTTYQCRSIISCYFTSLDDQRPFWYPVLYKNDDGEQETGLSCLFGMNNRLCLYVLHLAGLLSFSNDKFSVRKKEWENLMNEMEDAGNRVDYFHKTLHFRVGGSSEYHLIHKTSEQYESGKKRGRPSKNKTPISKSIIVEEPLLRILPRQKEFVTDLNDLLLEEINEYLIECIAHGTNKFATYNNVENKLEPNANSNNETCEDAFSTSQLSINENEEQANMSAASTRKEDKEYGEKVDIDERKYPLLCSIYPNKKIPAWTLENLVRESVALQASTCEHGVANFKHTNGRDGTFFRIPRISNVSDYNNFKNQVNKTNWIPTMLCHIAIGNRMDAATAAAMKTDARLGTAQNRIVRKYLRWVWGKKAKKNDTDENEKSEKLHYWTNIDISPYNIGNDKLGWDVVVGGDHGKGAFRNWIKVFTKSPSFCRDAHDKGELQTNSKMESRGGYSQLICLSDGDTIECKMIPKSAAFEIYVTGDLKFYSIVLGRENCDTYNCHLCKLNWKEWNKPDCADGEEWTLEKLKKELEENGTKNMFGIKESPHYTCIEPKNYPCPLLHMLIGLTNSAYNHFTSWIDEECELITPEEVVARNMVQSSTELYNNAMEQRRELEEMLDRNNRDLKQEKKALQKDKRAAKNSKDDALTVTLEEKIKSIEILIKDNDNNAEQKKTQTMILRESMNEWKKKVAALRKARGLPEESIVMVIDNILNKHDVARGAYHGGNFQGSSSATLVRNVDDIFSKTKPEINALRKRSDDVELTDEEVNTICDSYATLFLLLDSSFALLSKINPTKNEVEQARLSVTKTMFLWRKIGISITTKAHLFEKHIVDQMATLPGRLGNKREDFIEKGHQVGTCNDEKTRHMKDFRKKQLSHLKIRQMDANPVIVTKTGAVQDSTKRKFKNDDRQKSYEAAAKKQKKIHQEKRDHTIAEK